METQGRDCPVCGSTGPRKAIHRQRFEGGVLGEGYDVVICRSCGAGFADGILPQSELDRYYAERSKYAVAGAESPFDLRRFELIAEQLASRVSPEARLLDVGCATGGFLATLKARGFKAVMGADPSPACAEAAKRLHGIEVVTSGIAGLVSGIVGLGSRTSRPASSEKGRLVQDTNAAQRGMDSRFDVITLLGVLEHLRDTQAAIRELTKLLAPGGRIFLAIPDVQGLATSRNSPFQQFSMEHVNFFSRDSLARLMAECGYTLEAQWQEKVEWRFRVEEPILSGLFVANGKGQGGRTLSDTVTAKALADYIEVSAAVDLRIRAVINRLVSEQTPLLVWGAGALTRRLLAETALAKANIRAFVDSSPHAQAVPLIGRAVLAPSEIRGRTETIVVASTAFEQEITAIIRQDLHLPNELITFPAIGD